MTKVRIAWASLGEALVALEPELDEVRPHASVLAAAYNHPHNAPLMGHTSPLVEADVLDHYASLLGSGAHPFLLFCDGALAGDADLRGLASGVAEFAFMIAAPAQQGRGLGTRFATMIHAFAFTRLGLGRVYASVLPQNVASRRAFEKLGYVVDDSPAARSFGDPGDVTLAIDRATFERRHAAAIAEIEIAARSS